MNLPGFTAGSLISSARANYHMIASKQPALRDGAVTIAQECPEGQRCKEWGRCCVECEDIPNCSPCSTHFATGFCADYCKYPNGAMTQTSGTYWCWWGSGAHHKNPC